MKIAIISDIHENNYNLVSFYEYIEDKNIEQILCLWDIMNNWVAKLLAFSWLPVHMVWGNNDWEKVAITKTSLHKNSKLTVAATSFDTIEIDNKKIFLSHYPMLAKPMAKSWDFDVVFFGHTHKKMITEQRGCLIVNPWELSAHKTWTATFAIYDTQHNSAEIINLEDFKNMKFDKVSEYRKNIWFKYSESKEHKY